MNPAHLDEFVAHADRLGRAGVRISQSFESPQEISRKADSSLVTQADRAIEAHLTEEIAKAYPDHAILGEETLANPGIHASLDSARYCWVIDPLDGTRNYAAGIPCYATSIALLDHGEPIVGVIAEHNVGWVFTASSGQGATLNGQALPPAADRLGGSQAIGFTSNRDELSLCVLRRWLGTEGLVLRNLGSTAFQLALVASGGLAATFSKKCKIWDIAAGVVLVRETGGSVSDPFGKPITPFDLSADPDREIPTLAGMNAIHERLVTSIGEAWSTRNQ